MSRFPAIGVMNADGTATLSRDEVAWLRELCRRLTTAYGTSKALMRAIDDPKYMESVEQSARRGCALHIAEAAGIAVMSPRVAVDSVGREIDARDPAAIGYEFRAEITVLAGGYPPAPPQRSYIGSMMEAPQDIADLEAAALEAESRNRPVELPAVGFPAFLGPDSDTWSTKK